MWIYSSRLWIKFWKRSINLAAQFGPDGRLYVLSHKESSHDLQKKPVNGRTFLWQQCRLQLLTLPLIRLLVIYPVSRAPQPLTCWTKSTWCIFTKIARVSWSWSVSNIEYWMKHNLSWHWFVSSRLGWSDSFFIEQGTGKLLLKGWIRFLFSAKNHST